MYHIEINVIPENLQNSWIYYFLCLHSVERLIVYMSGIVCMVSRESLYPRFGEHDLQFRMQCKSSESTVNFPRYFGKGQDANIFEILRHVL